VLAVGCFLFSQDSPREFAFTGRASYAPLFACCANLPYQPGPPPLFFSSRNFLVNPHFVAGTLLAIFVVSREITLPRPLLSSLSTKRAVSSTPKARWRSLLCPTSPRFPPLRRNRKVPLFVSQLPTALRRTHYSLPLGLDDDISWFLPSLILHFNHSAFP